MDIRYTTEHPTAELLLDLYDHLKWSSILELSKEQLHRAMERSWHVVYAYQDNTLVGTGRVVSDGFNQRLPMRARRYTRI